MLPQSTKRQEKLQGPDRKSTRLNSSHLRISYAVFCLKKKDQHPLQACGRRMHGAGCGDGSTAIRPTRPGVNPPVPLTCKFSSKASVVFFFFLIVRDPRNSPLSPAPASPSG